MSTASTLIMYGFAKVMGVQKYHIVARPVNHSSRKKKDAIISSMLVSNTEAVATWL